MCVCLWDSFKRDIVSIVSSDYKNNASPIALYTEFLGKRTEQSALESPKPGVTSAWMVAFAQHVGVDNELS